MRWLLVPELVLLALFPTEASADAWADCAQPADRALIIRGCSTLIESGRESRENLWRAHYNRGLAFADQGDERAIEDFNLVIEARPNFAEAYIQRGLAYHAKGDPRQALTDFHKAVRLRPDLAFAFAVRGSAYIESDQWDSAIADFDRAIELRPQFTLGFYLRGLAYLGKQDFDSAIRDLDAAIKLNPKDAEAYSGRAEAYSRKGELTRARKDHDKAVELEPDSGHARYNRGVFFEDTNEIDRALADFRAAAELLPENDPWRQEALSRTKSIEARIAALTPPPSDRAPSRRFARIESSEQGLTIIFIEGQLRSGDGRAFVDTVIDVENAFIVLSSDGGDIAAALDIGKAIRLKGFSTLVQSGHRCASACALAWLGGQRRFMATGAAVGFHAAFEEREGQIVERGGPNAVIGGYLASLGYSPAAIYYMASSPPEQMNWLTFDLARELGLGVEEWKPDGEELEQPPQTSEAARPAAIPVSVIYGTPLACELFLRGGQPAVYSVVTSGPLEERLLATPRDITTFGVGCWPEQAAGDEVRLACYGNGTEWSLTATIRENFSAGTVAYSDNRGTKLKLARCPSTPPQTPIQEHSAPPLSPSP